MFQRALAISERRLGPDHPDTATSLDSLAVLYSDQGKYEEAKPMCMRALVICVQQLGLEHPDTCSLREQYRELARNMQP